MTKAGPGKAQKKGRSSGGRTTEAGSSVQSNRYTPPIPKKAKTSPRWLGLVIIALFVVGVRVVVPATRADASALQGPTVDVLKMQSDYLPALPVQKIRDLTFVFAEGE
jgi:hypothetical protein